jgi:hypothetical protein
VALLPLTVTALLQEAVLPFVVSKRPLLLVWLGSPATGCAPQLTVPLPSVSSMYCVEPA